MVWSHKTFVPYKNPEKCNFTKKQGSQKDSFRNTKTHMKLITGIIYIFDMELQTSIFLSDDITFC